MKKHDLTLQPLFLLEDNMAMQYRDIVGVDVDTNTYYRVNQHTGKFLEWRYAVCEIPEDKAAELKNEAAKVFTAPEPMVITAEEIVAWQKK